jgi:hypothetical protein
VLDLVILLNKIKLWRDCNEPLGLKTSLPDCHEPFHLVLRLLADLAFMQDCPEAHKHLLHRPPANLI